MGHSQFFQVICRRIIKSVGKTQTQVMAICCNILF